MFYKPIKLFSFLLILFKCMDLIFSDEGCLAENFSVALDSTKTFFTGNGVKCICVNGYNETTIWAIWADVEIVVETKLGVSINVVKGKSFREVHEKSKSPSFFAYALLFLRKQNDTGMKLSASPYGTTCFAISLGSESLWKIKAVFRKLNLLYPVIMTLGMVLFYEAEAIARSTLFYYAAGISIGMVLAIFLLLFIIAKFIPHRGLGYAFMVCGSSVVLYCYEGIRKLIFYGNFAENKMFYAYFIFADADISCKMIYLLAGSHTIIKGIISFLYCYYRGPIESARGLDIMRWSVQAVALCAVYNSIQCEKISLTFVLILIITKWIRLPGIASYILTRGWIPYRLQAYFRGPRFISMEEYEREGIEETAKALKELREYCESPQCNTWRTVSRLKSPKRFASFMSDGVDITPEEKKEYDETSFDYANYLTSDEDSKLDDSLTGEL